MLSWQAIEVIPGWFQFESYCVWRALLDEQTGTSGDLFEIGVWRGRSASVLANYRKGDEKLYLCDLHLDEAAVRESIRSTGIEPTNLVPLSGPSADLPAKLDLRAMHHTVRWFHIDGEHTGTTVYHELEIANQTVNPDGIVVIDDFFSSRYPANTTEAVRYMEKNPFHFRLLAVGFTVGTAGISAAERRLRSRRTPPAPVAGGEAAAVLGPEQLARAQEGAEAARRRALQTGMVIATAIGLHNFAEGLAIGVSAKAGAIGLATVLIIGFVLHNATEGFGIVGPLGGARPSWAWLGVAGFIGGAPTFLGTIVGYQVDSEPLELLFYALAAGAVLYVIGEIWTGMRRYGHHTLGLYMIAAGFLVGVATDLVVAYGGG